MVVKNILVAVVLALCAVMTSARSPPQNEFVIRPRLDGRIVGGYAINITDAPHQVSLQKQGHFCGGSIISSKFILTAAHCTDGQSAKQMKVRVGSSFHGSGGEIVLVKKIHQHSQFSYQNIDYDYSLLELDSELEFSDTVNKIELPESEEHVSDGEPCIVSGWGVTQGPEPRDKLRAAEVNIMNKGQCSKAYSNFGGVTDRMVCAGLDEGGKDACQGDSGGPMVCNGKLTGVVSWGYGCAKKGYPGVYSYVAVARDWIKSESGI